MEDFNKKLSKRWRVVTILFFVFIVVIFVQDLIREIIIFNQEANLIVEELNRDVRNEVEQNVNDVYNDFSYVIENITDDLVIHSQEEIEGLLFASEMIVMLNPTATSSETKDDLIDILREYNIDDPDHSFDLYTIDGVKKFDGYTGTEIDVDMINHKDDLNRSYIQELMTGIATSEHNDSYVSFYILEDNEYTHYAIYASKVASTDFVLASLVNLNRYTLKKQDDLIENIAIKYKEENSDLFVINKEGDILHHHNESLNGVNVYEIENETVRTLFQEIIGFVDENEFGHLEYDFFTGTDLDDTEAKVAYLRIVEEWDMIIGSSVSGDEYSDIIDEYVSDNYKLVLFVKVPSYVVLIIVSVFIYMYLQTTVRTSLTIVKEEEALYYRFANLTNEIIMITNKQGEIIFTNNLGRSIIFGQRERTNIFFDQIMVEEDGYYVLYGYTQDFFVKYVTEQIDYKNVEADLFIITDVTEKITTERKLENLSLIDELTELGNRRMLVKDYNDVVFPAVKSGKEAYLVMIDLDSFKPANDLYGHSYGDLVLKNIASIFLKNKTSNMMVYRVGGDEFAFMFFDVTKDYVEDKIKEIRFQVTKFPYDKQIDIGFSAGCAQIKLSDQERRFSDYFEKADKLLYKSKKEGKNRTSF